jgi:hypothetical protein
LHSRDSIDDDNVDNRVEVDLEDESKTYNYDDGREGFEGEDLVVL